MSSLPLEPWASPVIEMIARVLGHTDTGLTGPEIGQLLGSLKMHDPNPTDTKWRRLFAAFATSHNTMGGPKRIVTFITQAMSPLLYTGKQDQFVNRQESLNEVLVHVGLKVLDTGQLAKGPKASTLSEAAAHANTLRTELHRRGTHPEVI